MSHKVLTTLALLSILVTLAGCGAEPTPPPTPAPPPMAEELIFYDWEEDMPQGVLDAFTEEYGVQVTYLFYETQEEALENIRSGEVYDVVVIDNDFIPQFVEDGMLAEIDYRNVPNIKNISANFRDLSYDPGNKHSIPFNWGTSALVVRSDLVSISRWADLWELGEIGKIVMRDEPRDPLGSALKALGYSINTEDPNEVEEAFEYLLEIRQDIIIEDAFADAVIPLLDSGEVVAVVGWAEDVVEGREVNEAITYVIPEEGPMLWGDNFVIPANSPRKYTAEVFLNFLLRPEISAMIVNENYYANANEAAQEFIDPEIANDPAIFPPAEDLAKAEVYMPLSPEGEELYQETWARFIAADQ